MIEILLFNSVYYIVTISNNRKKSEMEVSADSTYGRVTPVSVSTLKPPLGVIKAILLKPQASPIVETCI